MGGDSTERSEVSGGWGKDPGSWRGSYSPDCSGRLRGQNRGHRGLGRLVGGPGWVPQACFICLLSQGAYVSDALRGLESRDLVLLGVGIILYSIPGEKCVQEGSGSCSYSSPISLPESHSSVTFSSFF